MSVRSLLVCVCVICAFASDVRAQDRVRVEAEGAGGWAGFADDATIHHAVGGGSLRVYVTPRASIGPEVAYMVGPGDDRDLIVTGNVTFDLRGPSPSERPAHTPYFVVGGGLFHHRDRFGVSTFSSTEGSFTAGGGLRVWIGDKAYVAPEARVGWELHLRATVAVGVRLGS